MNKLYCYDGKCFKWICDDGNMYMVKILQDHDAWSPREYDEHFSEMACWHRRYALGDKIDREIDPEEYWQNLVSKFVSDVDTEELSISDCQKLLKEKIFWMDLYLYDHSGITMSCSKHGNPFTCPWDSGQVGFIWISRKDVEEYYGVHGQDWKETAESILKDEVKEYDYYLRGDVYGFQLLEYVSDGEDSEWEDVDSIWGFYGDDMMTNGMGDELPGFKKAFEADEIVEGKQVAHTYYTYEF